MSAINHFADEEGRPLVGPGATEWTDNIPAAEAKVGDWIEAMVWCGPKTHLAVRAGKDRIQVPRRGRIESIAGSVIRFTHRSGKQHLTTRPDILNAWGYRPPAPKPNVANLPPSPKEPPDV